MQNGQPLLTLFSGRNLPILSDALSVYVFGLLVNNVVPVKWITDPRDHLRAAIVRFVSLRPQLLIYFIRLNQSPLNSISRADSRQVQR